VDGIDGPTTKAFWAPPFWRSLESPGPVVIIHKNTLSNPIYVVIILKLKLY